MNYQDPEFPYDVLSEDVLDEVDTISIEELEGAEQDQLSTAGIDGLTAVDTFLNLQGDKTFVTDL